MRVSAAGSVRFRACGNSPATASDGGARCIRRIMVSSIRLPAENRAAELAASFPYHRTEPQPQPESLRACAEKPAGKGAPAIRLLMEGGVHVVARDIVQKPLVHFL